VRFDRHPKPHPQREIQVSFFRAGAATEWEPTPIYPRKKPEKLMGWPGVEPGRPFGLQIFAPLWL
jgi:hypothetical protein